MKRDLLYNNIFGVPEMRIKETDDEFMVEFKICFMNPDFRGKLYRGIEMLKASAREVFDKSDFFM